MRKWIFAVFVAVLVICGQSEVKGATISENDLESIEILAKCVESEAGNQGLMGKRFVVDVILNRIDSETFPDDALAVISQRGQFSVWSSGKIHRTEPSEETYEAIRLELEHRTDDKILFFASGNFNKCCVPAYRHGDHYFGYIKPKEDSE